MVEDKLFREDLYFRLNVIPIHIPALRDRPEDIELLLSYVIDKCSSQLGKPVTRMDESAKKLLTSYAWPGNIREMENVIEYAINMAGSSTIHLPDLPDRLIGATVETPRSPTGAILSTGTLKEQLAMTEKSIISAAIDNYGDSLEGKRQAAKALGISESTLYRRLRSHTTQR